MHGAGSSIIRLAGTLRRGFSIRICTLPRLHAKRFQPAAAWYFIFFADHFSPSRAKNDRQGEEIATRSFANDIARGHHYLTVIGLKECKMHVVLGLVGVLVIEALDPR